jgi:hypothetical protein
MYISISSIESESRIIERDFSFFSLKKVVLKFMIQFLEGILDKIIQKVTSDLDRCLIGLKGAYAIIDAYTPEQAKEELDSVKKAIIIFRKANNKLQEINYFDNSDVECKVKGCVSLLQDIDILLRKKAFTRASVQKISEESILMKALAEQSMSALSKSLAR